MWVLREVLREVPRLRFVHWVDEAAGRAPLEGLNALDAGSAATMNRTGT
jgi:hypothetical protein